MAHESDLKSPQDPYSILKNPTLEDIPDHRGPRVWDESRTPSFNQRDPDYYSQKGVSVKNTK